jgi:threonine dehydratase
MATKTAPDLREIEEARARLEGVVHPSPVYGSETLSRYTDRAVSLKAENLQRTGSFKIRGAVNKLATLTEAERGAGVVAASAGNHGQAVAWAARAAGVKATGTVIENGSVADQIGRFAKRQKADLIGMGTHGHGIIARALLGSVAERVMSRAPCPVMVVRG